jgi:hypothetical protein
MLPRNGDDPATGGLKLLQEILPTLKEEILLEILRGNNYDLEKSTESALALSVSLSTEEGKAVLNSKSQSSSAVETKSSAEMSISYHQSRKPDFGVSQNVAQSRRGEMCFLPSHFLSSPKFRVVIDHESDKSIEFTVSFNRNNEKLGITIVDVDGDIAVHSLQWKNMRDDIPSLAMEAGVRIGDYLIGIDSEFFSPGVEVQDVIDMFQLTGNYITLHFTRLLESRKPSKNNEKSRSLTESKSDTVTAGTSSKLPIHKCAQILVDQTVITADRAQTVSVALARLKQRVLQWDTGFISQRIVNWKLYKYDQKPTKSRLAAIRERVKRSMSRNGEGSDKYNNLPHGNISSPPSSSPSSSSSAPTSSYMMGNVTEVNNLYGSGMTSDMMSDHLSTADGQQDIVVNTRNLRPALSIQVVHAEERRNHTGA